MILKRTLESICIRTIYPNTTTSVIVQASFVLSIRNLVCYKFYNLVRFKGHSAMQLHFRFYSDLDSNCAALWFFCVNDSLLKLELLFHAFAYLLPLLIAL